MQGNNDYINFWSLGDCKLLLLPKAKKARDENPGHISTDDEHDEQKKRKTRQEADPAEVAAKRKQYSPSPSEVSDEGSSKTSGSRPTKKQKSKIVSPAGESFREGLAEVRDAIMKVNRNLKAMNKKLSQGNEKTSILDEKLDDLQGAMKLVGTTVFHLNKKSLQMFPLQTAAKLQDYVKMDPDLTCMTARLSNVDYSGCHYATHLLVSIFTPEMIRKKLTWPSKK
jgi:hypothetical protein